MDPTIRVESPADFQVVEQIHREAFGGEYEPAVARKLREDPDYISELSLVAEFDGRIVGHIVLSRMRFEDPASPDNPREDVAAPSRRCVSEASSLCDSGAKPEAPISQSAAVLNLSQTTRAGPCTILGLGPVGVIPSMQKHGIGTALIREAIERARAMGFSGLVLLGHPTYYPRFGFRPASEFGISFNYDVPDDVAMALPLTTEPLAKGKVFYSPAFDQ